MTKIPPEVLKKIRRIQFFTTRLVNAVFSGAYRSAFRGRGLEFEEVRDYIEGDDDRLIDWNVTARMNHPYIKTFREERDLTVMLIVDISQSSDFGTSQKLKRDLIAEIGAVLAFSAIKNWDRIGLILFTDHIEQYVPPRKGTRHVLRIVRELLAFEPTGKGTDIAEALKFCTHVLKQTGVCFLISDFITSQDFSHPFKLLAKKQNLISILVSDPRERDFPKMNLVQLRDPETGELLCVDTSDESVKAHLEKEFQERLNKVKTLAGKVGTGFLEIATDQSYADIIHNYFKQRKK